jgi:hypothetical protein
MPYRSLDPDRIVATIETLQRRIDERFPNRGLSRLCAELLAVAREDRERASWMHRPNFWIRGGVAVVLAAGAAAAVFALLSLPAFRVEAEAFNALSGIEAVFNIIALVGAAVWFLLNLEAVWRRDAVLADLHELRSLAHVVDMHQLTKDPVRHTRSLPDTASSPASNLTPDELERYLDYCSEMLALTGKLAALYMRDVRDPVIIQTVDEIETLTSSLARKIWQKIMVLRQPGSALDGSGGAP